MNEHDIQKIQETLAHQEMQINDLSDMIISLSSEIKALNKKIDKLTAKLEQFQGDSNSDESGALSPTDFAAQNKPPHW